MWPQPNQTPISEFTTEGYFSMAFPTLFPDGSGDFTAPRMRPVTIGHYLKHLCSIKTKGLLNILDLDTLV